MSFFFNDCILSHWLSVSISVSDHITSLIWGLLFPILAWGKEQKPMKTLQIIQRIKLTKHQPNNKWFTVLIFIICLGKKREAGKNTCNMSSVKKTDYTVLSRTFFLANNIIFFLGSWYATPPCSAKIKILFLSFFLLTKMRLKYLQPWTCVGTLTAHWKKCLIDPEKWWNWSNCLVHTRPPLACQNKANIERKEINYCSFYKNVLKWPGQICWCP